MSSTPLWFGSLRPIRLLGLAQVDHAHLTERALRTLPLVEERSQPWKIVQADVAKRVRIVDDDPSNVERLKAVDDVAFKTIERRGPRLGHAQARMQPEGGAHRRLAGQSVQRGDVADQQEVAVARAQEPHEV